MSAADLIRLTELVSSILIVFGFGLRSTMRDASALFRHPLLLVRSLFAMNVLLPLIAALMVAMFALRPPIGIALIAVAVSPVPPFLPGQQLKLVTRQEYVLGLFGASSLLAIIVAPVSVALIGLLFTRQISIAPIAIAKIVALTVLVPFSLGMIVRRRAAALAERVSPIVGNVGIFLLVVAAVPVLFTTWSEMISLIGNGTLIALVAFTLVSLAAGHLLGGRNPDNRTILALAAATRHPGVALTIATQMFPDQHLVAPALLLYLFVSGIASAPYILWRMRQRKKLGSTRF
jgi:bile acid:Na+ symporter, BASS family